MGFSLFIFATLLSMRPPLRQKPKGFNYAAYVFPLGEFVVVVCI